MSSAIQELYQEVILDHNKSPRNFRVMQDADRNVEGYNPLCGDHYMVYVKMKGDVIEDVSFTGAGCAISKASASVMTLMMKGKSVHQAEQLFQDFHQLVKGEAKVDGEMERLGRMAAFSGVSEFPARVKCATLAWHTLRAALESKEETVSTE
jgi:nitrogen fixation NifU-like protein